MPAARMNKKRFISLLLITALIWIVQWPIVTSGNIRMDSDRMLHTPDIALNQYVQEGRSALVWLLRFFGLDSWHPVKSGVLFLVFFSISCWMLYFTLRRYAGWDKLHPDLFLLIYGLSPIWAYHGYFVVQIAAVGFGMMLAVLTACMDARFFPEKTFTKYRFLWETAALILLSFAILVYQSLIICWMAALLMFLFCHLLRGGQISWRTLFPFFLRLAACLIIYFIVSRLTRSGTAATNMDIQIRWGTDSISHCLMRIIEECGATVLMATSRYFSLYTLGVVLVLILLLRRRKKDTGKNAWLWIVFSGMLLLPFGLSILLGNVTVPRSQFALQLTAAFLPVCFLSETEGRHRILCAVCIAAVAVQTGLFLRLYHSDQIRNSQDIATAEAVITELKQTDTSKPLAFIGVRRMEASPVLTEKSDVYGRSFFEWIYTPDHPASSTIPALRLLTAYSGEQYEGIINSAQEAAAAESARQIPSYPSPGFVREENDMIIIKLSDP